MPDPIQIPSTAWVETRLGTFLFSVGNVPPNGTNGIEYAVDESFGVLEGDIIIIDGDYSGSVLFRGSAPRDNFILAQVNNLSNEELIINNVVLRARKKRMAVGVLEPTTKMLVVPYAFPADADLLVWNKAIENARAVGYIIVNQDDGMAESFHPGDPVTFSTQASPSYTTIVARLKDAGIKIIGYIPTGYGVGNLAQLKDLNSLKHRGLLWTTFFAGMLDGYFLDEGSQGLGPATGSDGGLACVSSVYQPLVTYLRTLIPNAHIVLNCGVSDINETYASFLDTICTFENFHTEYASYTFPAWQTDGTYPSSRFLNLIHGTHGIPDLTATLALAKIRNVGFVYITDVNSPNGDNYITNWRPATNTPPLADPTTKNVDDYVTLVGLTVAAANTSPYPIYTNDDPPVVYTGLLYADFKVVVELHPISGLKVYHLEGSPWNGSPSYFDTEASLIEDTIAASGFAPSNAWFWFEADSLVTSTVEDGVTAWTDRASGNNVVPQISTNSGDGLISINLVENSTNGKPAIEFGGNQPGLACTLRTLNQPVTLMTVFYAREGGKVVIGSDHTAATEASNGFSLYVGGDGEISVYSGIGDYQGTGADYRNQWVLVTLVIQQGAVSELRVNGVLEYTFTAGTFPFKNLAIGSYYQDYGNVFVGKIAAAIMFSGVLADDVREIQERRLAIKYGLTYQGQSFGSPQIAEMVGSGSTSAAGLVPAPPTYDAGGALSLDDKGNWTRRKSALIPLGDLITNDTSNKATSIAINAYSANALTTDATPMVAASFGKITDGAITDVTFKIRCISADKTHAGSFEYTASVIRNGLTLGLVSVVDEIRNRTTDAGLAVAITCDTRNIFVTVTGLVATTITWIVTFTFSPDPGLAAITIGATSDTHGTDASSIQWFGRMGICDYAVWNGDNLDSSYIFPTGTHLITSWLPATNSPPLANPATLNAGDYVTMTGLGAPAVNSSPYIIYHSDLATPYVTALTATDVFIVAAKDDGTLVYRMVGTKRSLARYVSEIGQYFTTQRDANKMITVLGNHSVDFPVDGNPLATADIALLIGAAGFNTGQTTRYGHTRWNNVHNFYMNTEAIAEPDGVSATGVQVQYLLKAARESTAPFKVLWLHRPPYISETEPPSYAPGTAYVSDLQELFFEFDAVISGHTHIYERMARPINGRIVQFISCPSPTDSVYRYLNGAYFDPYSVSRFSANHNPLVANPNNLNSGGVLWKPSGLILTASSTNLTIQCRTYLDELVDSIGFAIGFPSNLPLPGLLPSALTIGLLSYYKMDEAAAAGLTDQLGVNTMNVISGAPGSDVINYKIVKSRTFIRASLDSFRVNDSVSLRWGHQDKSLSLWIRPTTAIGIVQMLVSKGSEIQLYIDIDGSVVFNLWQGAAYQGIRSTTLLSAGNWYHILVQNNSVAEQMEIQINNGTTDALHYGATHCVSGVSGMYLGAESPGTANNFGGNMDEAGIWSKYLSSLDKATLQVPTAYPF